MRAFTVNMVGKILNYITVHLIDNREVLLEDWMFKVGMMYVPVPSIEFSVDSKKFTVEELRQMGIQLQPDDQLAPQKLVDLPVVSNDGSILVLINTNIDIFEQRGEEHRIQRPINLCEIRKPFTKEQWIDFFTREWNFYSSSRQENPNVNKPEWIAIASNYGSALAILPINEGFEVVCGYVEGSRASPTQFIAYRYDNVGQRLVCRNSLAAVARELEELWTIYARVKKQEQAVPIPRFKKLEVD